MIPTLELAKKLIASQFPQYADLNVTEVEEQGHDNRTYRIGNEMLIRMPTAESYALKIPKEQELLPKLAKHLSIAIPAPIKMGKSSNDYPYPFSIYKWLEGGSANHVTLAPIKMGKPSKDYPYPFSIYKWLEGRSANHVTLDEKSLENLAFELATFLKELQAITDIEGLTLVSIMGGAGVMLVSMIQVLANKLLD